MKKSLIVVVIIALLGFGGWFVYPKNKDEARTDSNSQNSPPTTQSLTPAATNDPSEDGKYLVIKEWGVRFKKGDRTQDLIYHIRSDNPDGINFGISSLAQKYPSCTPEKTGLSRGLSRSKDKTTFESAGVEPFAEIGGYYYVLASGGASCFDIDKAPAADNESYSTARTELTTLLRSLESINN